MNPLAHADGDAVPVAPDDLAPAHDRADPGGQRGEIAIRRGNARLRGPGSRGIRGRGWDRRGDECGNHRQAEQQVGKFDGFHEHDPPLIVERIVECGSNRLMTLK